jgi:hypothetical protein
LTSFFFHYLKKGKVAKGVSTMARGYPASGYRSGARAYSEGAAFGSPAAGGGPSPGRAAQPSSPASSRNGFPLGRPSSPRNPAANDNQPLPEAANDNSPQAGQPSVPTLTPRPASPLDDLPPDAGAALGALSRLPGPLGSAAAAAAAALDAANNLAVGPRAVIVPSNYVTCWSSDCQNGTIILRQDAAVGCLASSFMCLGGQGSQGPNTPQYSLGGAGVFSVFKVSWVDIGPNGSGGRNYRETNMAQYCYNNGSPTHSPRFMPPPPAPAREGGARSPNPQPDPTGDPAGRAGQRGAPGSRPGTGPAANPAADPFAAPEGLPSGLPRRSPAVRMGRVVANPLADPYRDAGVVREAPLWLPAARPQANPGRSPVIPGRPDLVPIRNPIATPIPLPFPLRVGSIILDNSDYRAVGSEVPAGLRVDPNGNPEGEMLDKDGRLVPGRINDPGLLNDPVPNGDPELRRILDPKGARELARLLSNSNARNMPPVKGVKEKKTRGLRAAYAIIGQLTEFDEALECAWKQLPKGKRSPILGRQLHQGTPTIYYWKKSWAKKHGKTDAQIEAHNKTFKAGHPVHQKPQTMVGELAAYGQFDDKMMAGFQACHAAQKAGDFLVGRSNQLANKGFFNARGGPPGGGNPYGAPYHPGVGSGPAM